MKHIKYLSYIIRHKWFVFLAGLKTGAPIWLLLTHDITKFLPSEWFPYVNFFYGSGEDSIKYAFLYHKRRNPHHWEYWLLEDGTPLEMPEKYVREMVADWAGAGRVITGSWGVRYWYSENKDKIILHKNTRLKVQALLQELF